jgi:hypothetical protein
MTPNFHNFAFSDAEKGCTGCFQAQTQFGVCS